jgi:hypothetical protein
MNISDVMAEIAEAVAEIDGLRVQPQPIDNITPPAGVVAYADSIDYDQTYGRGVDRIRGIPLWIVTGKVTSRAAREAMGAYSAGRGDKSIKQRLEGRGWASCDDVTVTSCRFDTVTEGGVDYLAAMFTIDAIGPGS